MPHLASFREGWKSENLARYILSNFAFLSQPVSVSDDIGSDFFCTLFQIHTRNKKDFLIPKNAFAIQIKSKPKNFDVTDKLDYLRELEIPFFVGVCDQKEMALTIYSGENLIPSLLEIRGEAETQIHLCNNNNGQGPIYTRLESGTYTINFPKLFTLSAEMSKSDIREKAGKLVDICSLINKNITRRDNKEYIFFKSYSPDFLILSRDKTILQSLNQRTSKLLFELAWILEKKPEVFSPNQQVAYQELLDSLLKVGQNHLDE